MQFAAPSNARAATTVVVALLALAATAPAAVASPGGVQYGQASQTPSPSGPNPGGIDPSLPLPTPTPAPAPAPIPIPIPSTPLTPPAPGQVARVLADGTAVAPAGAPAIVQAMIAAGNRIATKRYVWGGGHARWEDKGYDCSGSVSYALHAAGLLASPLVSGDLAHWGQRGPGTWVTIYANAGHVYMTIAGLRFDTSGQRSAGTRWQAQLRSSRHFHVRHPAGL